MLTPGEVAAIIGQCSLTAVLAGLGLEPKAAKTPIVHLEEGGGGVDFLGFHHRLVRSKGTTGERGVVFLARWPADKAMQYARDRIRQIRTGPGCCGRRSGSWRT